ncbi:MAG: hypothetical protein AAF740_10635, partial [Bacteroidota bacterium]
MYTKLLLSCITLFFAVSIGWGQTEYFVKQGSSGVGTSFADAFGDLQDALDVASNGDKIYVAVGTYYPSTQYDFNTGNVITGDPRAASFKIPSGVQVYGGFSGNETGAIDQAVLDARDFDTNETVLSGDIGVLGNTSDNSYHVVCTINVILTKIDAFTITRGRTKTSSGRGAGLFNIATQSNNYYLTVENCIFDSNRAVTG